MDSIKCRIGKSSLISSYKKIVAAGGLKVRAVQEDMLKDISEAIASDGRGGCFEAPTGSGKSLVIALSAFTLAANENEPHKSIISTPRIDLQSSLLDELSALAALFPKKKVTFAVLKGKTNYISPVRLDQDVIMEAQDRGLAEVLAAGKLVAAKALAYAGDYQLIRADPEVIEAISNLEEEEQEMFAPDRICLPLYKHKSEDYEKGEGVEEDSTYYEAARAKALAADIIVANHSLLATQIFFSSRGRDIIPDFEQRIVFLDEAHALASRVLDKLAKKASFYRTSNAINSVVSATRRFSPESSSWTSGLKKIANDIDKLEKAINSQMGRSDFIRIHDKKFLKQCEVFIDAAQTLQKLAEGARNIIQKNFSGKQAAVRLRKKMALDDLQSAIDAAKSWVSHANVSLGKGRNMLLPAACFTVRTSPVKRRVSFEKVSATCDGIMYMYFWSRVRKAILFSGTMADPYSYVQSIEAKKNRRKLPSERLFTQQMARLGGLGKKLGLVERVYAAPFSWDAVCYVDESIDAIDFSGDDLIDEKARSKYMKLAAEKISEACKTAKGGMLVLSAAHADIAFLVEHLRAAGCSRTLVVHGKGEGDIKTLSEAKAVFCKDSGNSILFSPSGWEGLDLPGNQLTDLVIVRIPFDSPSSPQSIAIRDYYQNIADKQFIASNKTIPPRKASAYGFAVANAFNTFRQGLGRLCRKEGDTGNIYILDKRVLDAEKRAFSLYLEENFAIPKPNSKQKRCAA